MAVSWELLTQDEKIGILSFIDLLFSHVVRLSEDVDSLWWLTCSLDKSLSLPDFSSYRYPAMEKILDHPMMKYYSDFYAEYIEMKYAQDRIP
jgi:hypothetical protein